MWCASAARRRETTWRRTARSSEDGAAAYRDLHASLNRTLNTTASPGHRCYPHAQPWHLPGATSDRTVRCSSRARGGQRTRCTCRGSTSPAARASTSSPWARRRRPRCRAHLRAPAGPRLAAGARHGRAFPALRLHAVDALGHAGRGRRRVAHIDRDAGVGRVARHRQRADGTEVDALLRGARESLWLAKATPRGCSPPAVADRRRLHDAVQAGELHAACGGTRRRRLRSPRERDAPPSFAAPPDDDAGCGLCAVGVGGTTSGVTVGAGGVQRGGGDGHVPAAKLAAAPRDGLPRIVATFSGPKQPLRPSRFDPKKRVVDAAPPLAPPAAPAPSEATQAAHAVPSCPGTTTRVDAFDLNGTAWVACEDLQAPGGALVLASAAGDLEWFEKTYQPYGTNATDGEYYLGFNRSTLANALTDLSGEVAIEADVGEGAAPPIRVSGEGGEWAPAPRTPRRHDWGHVIPGHDWDGCAGAPGRHDRDPGLLQCRARADSAVQPERRRGRRRRRRHSHPIFICQWLTTGRRPTDGAYGRRFHVVGTASRTSGTAISRSRVRARGCSRRAACTASPSTGTVLVLALPRRQCGDTLRQTLRTGPVARVGRRLLPNAARQPEVVGARACRGGIARLRCRRPPPPTARGCSRRRRAMIVDDLARASGTAVRRLPRLRLRCVERRPRHVIATATAALVGFAAVRGGRPRQPLQLLRPRRWTRPTTPRRSLRARALSLLALYDGYSGDGAPLLLAHFDKAKALAEMLLARRNASLHYAPTDPRYGMLAGADDAVHRTRCSATR